MNSVLHSFFDIDHEESYASGHLRFLRSKSAGIVLLNRPDRANAYCREMVKAFESVLECCAGPEDTLKILILASSDPRYFCSGADRGELDARRAEDSFALPIRSLCNRLAAWPKPSLALAEGAVRGGGCELALACDIRITCEAASWGFPEVGLGLIPAAGGCRRLVSLAGPGTAKDMILFGRILSGREASEAGLAQYCLHRSEDAWKLAAELAARVGKCGGLALRLAKEACRRAEAEETESGSYEACAQALLYERRFSAINSSKD